MAMKESLSKDSGTADHEKSTDNIEDHKAKQEAVDDHHTVTPISETTESLSKLHISESTQHQKARALQKNRPVLQESSLNPGIDMIQKGMLHVQAELAENRVTMKGLEEKLQSVTSAKDKLEQKLEQAKADRMDMIKDKDKEIKLLKAKLDKLEDQLDEHRSEIARMQKEQLETQLKKLENERVVADLKSQMVILKTESALKDSQRDIEILHRDESICKLTEVNAVLMMQLDESKASTEKAQQRQREAEEELQIREEEITLFTRYLTLKKRHQ